MPRRTSSRGSRCRTSAPSRPVRRSRLRGVNHVPSAGPYYVASYTPGQGAVLKRNPNYHGSRPHALDEIDYSVGIGAAQIVKEIDDGTADFGVVDDLPARTAREPRRPLRLRQPGRPSRRTAVLRQLTARPREPRPEHEPTVVRKRGPAQSGQLRARPPGDRPRLPTPGRRRPTSISSRPSRASATPTSTRSRGSRAGTSASPEATEATPSSMPARRPPVARSHS